MILLIDNYDSFVYNLARYVSELGFTPKVIRNDMISVDEVIALSPSKIIISPGPCNPDTAGISLKLIRDLGHKIPLLGVCLGHQAIGQAYGGKVVRAQEPMHGKVSMISHQGEGLFANLSSPLKVARYHSLIVDRESLPDCLMVTADSKDGEIMALSHKRYPVHGVQFHPESIITQDGYKLLNNFLTAEQRVLEHA